MKWADKKDLWINGIVWRSRLTENRRHAMHRFMFNRRKVARWHRDMALQLRLPREYRRARTA